jgi:malonate decarboxylase epsilon subunit
MCAGHSVGAFAAAVICGALPFAAAIDCVRARALAMLAAAPAGYGMAALVGLTESRVTGLIRALQDEGAPIFLSAVNAPCQIVLSGSRPVLELAMNRARSLGAQSATLLNVAVPSHCELMLDVASAVRRALAAAELAPAHTVYICNCNSRAVDDAQSIREDLINGVVCPVRWHDATRILVERGARLLIEMQPGQSLSDLAGRAFPTLRTAAMSNMKLGSLTRLALTMSVPNS